MLGSPLHYRQAYNCMKTRDPNIKNPPNQEAWDKAPSVHRVTKYRFIYKLSVPRGLLQSDRTILQNLGIVLLNFLLFFFYDVYRILMLVRETSKDRTPLLGQVSFNINLKFEKYWMTKEANVLQQLYLILHTNLSIQTTVKESPIRPRI